MPDPTTRWRLRHNAPAPGQRLCPTTEVVAENGRECTFGNDGDGTGGRPDRRFRVVVFRVGEHDADVRAYVNECPHQGIAFDFGGDLFCVYDVDGRRDLMCPHHAALFHLEDGLCHDGPCKGHHLIPVPVVVADGWVRIA